MMHEISFWVWWILPLFIFFAGFVDAIAGGGGIIAIPAYLAAGINPSFVLGTNKLSSAMGTVVSTRNYYRRVQAPIKDFIPVILVSLFGSMLGAKTILLIDPNIIRILLLVIIPIVALTIYRHRSFGQQDQSLELTAGKILQRCMVIGLVIGYYDGFFGPGTGTFLALCFSRFVRFDLLKSSAYAKYINLSSNLAALATFMWAGKVRILLGIYLGLFGIVGHYLGSHLAIKNGSKVIRPVIFVVLTLLFAKVIYDLVG
jgi:uncharacterized membrane protein YfcA